MLNILDILLLLPLLYGFYSGYSKGLISQFTGLVGIVVAFLFGVKLSSYIGAYLLEQGIVNPAWSGIVGFVVTMMGIFLALKLAGNIVRRTSKFIGLGFIEKLAGGVLGSIKYGLIVMILLVFFVKLNQVLEIVPQGTLKESMLYPYYQTCFEAMYEYWNPKDNTNLT
ncbi:MAG: CvpA family protein [Weeksellaceae bacterium]